VDARRGNHSDAPLERGTVAVKAIGPSGDAVGPAPRLATVCRHSDHGLCHRSGHPINEGMQWTKPDGWATPAAEMTSGRTRPAAGFKTFSGGAIQDGAVNLAGRHLQRHDRASTARTGNKCCSTFAPSIYRPGRRFAIGGGDLSRRGARGSGREGRSRGVLEIQLDSLRDLLAGQAAGEIEAEIDARGYTSARDDVAVDADALPSPESRRRRAGSRGTPSGSSPDGQPGAQQLRERAPQSRLTSRSARSRPGPRSPRASAPTTARRATGCRWRPREAAIPAPRPHVGSPARGRRRRSDQTAG
jgi:hypothetical protein